MKKNSVVIKRFKEYLDSYTKDSYCDKWSKETFILDMLYGFQVSLGIESGDRTSFVHFLSYIKKNIIPKA